MEQIFVSAELLKVLEPFKIATTFFSFKENPSMSCVLPLLHSLMKKLSSSSDDLTKVHQFKQKLKAEIAHRWSYSLDGDNILVLGCILDHRFKQVKFLSNDGKESVKQEIVKRKENIMMTEEPDDDDDDDDEDDMQWMTVNLQVHVRGKNLLHLTSYRARNQGQCANK